ncbi:response regulator transcription factor [Paenibacillus thalictri]|uniref:Response regulator transcription factor n=1 Tax=Paenibacillus thalictri TaxID=2527873 RepID=A0A4Q9DLP0_9BACL|nr:response regulator transcription factor [Paenibacillus thalictri]TBL72440.1 response regulator transcription factor [Paenibacillus thalictri]
MNSVSVLAKSDWPQRLQAKLSQLKMSSVPWTDCGIIAAATRSISPARLQHLKKHLGTDNEEQPVFPVYEANDGVLTIVLPGQSLQAAHFTALSAKAQLEQAGLLTGGMAVTSFSESAPASEATLSDFAAMLQRDEPSEIAVYSGQSLPSDTPTVVMIDPNTDLLDFLNVRLGLQGYDVRPAQDGMEGLRLVESVQPDLVITELALPALDGHQVIRRIRQTQNQACQVVVLTDLAVEQDICKCFELGAADVIKKPFSPVELEARLKRLLA